MSNKSVKPVFNNFLVRSLSEIMFQVNNYYINSQGY